jgi:hypothetical protein
VWNLLGLASLLNVVARGVLTAPGVLNVVQAEVPNRGIGLFPFTYIPGFMVPLALTLHVLAWRVARTTQGTPSKGLMAHRKAS